MAAGRALAAALMAMTPVAVTAAPVQDSGLIAVAQARLAESEGDAAAALSALAQVSSAAPDLPGLTARQLDQALIAGDFVVARSAAARMWQGGDRSIAVRMVMLTDAVRRSDWRGARQSIDTSADKTGGRDAVARLVNPAVLSWINVAERAAEPLKPLADARRAGAFGDLFAMEAALIDAATGKADAAIAAASEIAVTDRSAQIVAARIAATLAAQGRGEAAAALRARLDAAGAASAALYLPDQPVSAARGGIGHWLAILSEGVGRAPGSNTNIPLLFARCAVWIAPDDAQARLALVAALVRLDHHDVALNELERSRAAPSALLALVKAELLVEADQGARALELAQAAVRAQDAPSELVLRAADIARKAGDSNAAIALIDRVLARPFDGEAGAALHASLLVGKADLLIRGGRWDMAKPLLEEAVALQPDDPVTLNFAGYSALERREDLTLATQRIEAAWKADPRNSSIQDSLGWAYLVGGDIPRAVEMLERAMRGDPANAVIVEHLGDAYWQAGQRIDARYSWRAAAVVADEDAMRERLTAKLRDGLTAETMAP